MGRLARYAADLVKTRTSPSFVILAVSLAALVGLIATGCDRGQAWVARVDGTAVKAPHFNQGVANWAELNNGATPPPSGATTTTVEGVASTSDASQYALLLVEAKAIDLLLAKHGITVTDAQRASTRSSLLSQPGGASLKNMPKWFQDEIVDLQANYAALVAYYGKGINQDAAARKYYAANKDTFDQLCVDITQTADKASADAARKRLDQGVPFATVAKDVAKAAGSQAAGTKQDGDIGCIAVSQFAQVVLDKGQFDDLTSLADGAIGGPYSATGGAYLIVRKRSTKTLSYADAKAQIISKLGQPGQTEASAALNKFLRTADIELNPRYGTWTKGKGYTAPVGAELPPGATTTTLPALAAG